MNRAREALLQRFVSGWNNYRENGSGNDYDIAQHFATERNRPHYLNGAAGDAAFKKVVRTYLVGISGSRALDYIKVLSIYPNRETWVNLHGFKGLFYTLGLRATTRQRTALMRAALDKAAEQRSPVTQPMIAKLARERNLVSNRATRTGPSNLRILAQFIVDEYDSVPDAIIDAMPADLRAAFQSVTV